MSNTNENKEHKDRQHFHRGFHVEDEEIENKIEVNSNFAPPAGPPPPEKKTLTYLITTSAFKEKIININELLYPIFFIQFQKKIEIFNLENFTKIDEIQLESDIDHSFSMGSNLLLFSTKGVWSIYDSTLKKIIASKKLQIHQIFSNKIEIRHIPNSNKFAYPYRHHIKIVDYKKGTESINVEMGINDFIFINENKFVITDGASVAIYEFGNQIFKINYYNGDLYSMIGFQAFKDDFMMKLLIGFHYFHKNQIQKVLLMDFKFLTMISENIFLKMNSKNKLEIFSVGLDSKVKSMKILQMESDGSLDNVILASNGDLLTWYQFDVRHWDTHQFIKSISIESHFVNSFKTQKLFNLKFKF
jgi:hypothetical protein